MGGDFAPQAIVEGALMAARQFPADVEIVLVGQPEAIQAILEQHPDAGSLSISIKPASQVIEMGEHPTKALQQKTDSSISLGFALLKTKEAQALLDTYITIRTQQLQAIGSVKGISGESKACRKALAIQLYKNLLHILLINAEQTDQVKAYFDVSFVKKTARKEEKQLAA